MHKSTKHGPEQLFLCKKGTTDNNHSEKDWHDVLNGGCVSCVSLVQSCLHSQQRKMSAAMLLRTDMMYNIMNREESTNSTMNIT
jgi:hypothetical protein